MRLFLARAVTLTVLASGTLAAPLPTPAIMVAVVAKTSPDFFVVLAQEMVYGITEDFGMESASGGKTGDSMTRWFADFPGEEPDEPTLANWLEALDDVLRSKSFTAIIELEAPVHRRGAAQ